MRYYDISITQVSSGNVIRHWTSHPNGPSQAPDPGALNIEFDVLVSPTASPATDVTKGDYGTSMIRVWGVPITDIAQAANLSCPTGSAPTYSLVLKGGMGKGLPLANPSQAGIIIQGGIWRAIGNWIGTDMTLDFYLTQLPPVGSMQGNQGPGVPALPITNFTFHWPAGQNMATAINSTLQTAYPSMTRNINISAQLVLKREVNAVYSTIQEFASVVNSLSLSTLGGSIKGYRGVLVFQRDGAIWVVDNQGDDSTQATGGTTAPQTMTRSFAFTDLIGQPTWVGNNVVQVTTVLRGDTKINDQITFPNVLNTVTAAGAINATSVQSLASSRFTSAFQGTCTVTDVRHVGNYKSPQGQSWISIFTAFLTPGAAVAASPPPTSSPAPTPIPKGSVTVGDITISP